MLRLRPAASVPLFTFISGFRLNGTWYNLHIPRVVMHGVEHRVIFIECFLQRNFRNAPAFNCLLDIWVPSWELVQRGNKC